VGCGLDQVANQIVGHAQQVVDLGQATLILDCFEDVERLCMLPQRLLWLSDVDVPGAEAVQAVDVRTVSKGKDRESTSEGMQSGRRHSSVLGSTPDNISQASVLQSLAVLTCPQWGVLFHRLPETEVAYECTQTSCSQKGDSGFTSLSAAYQHRARAKVNVAYVERYHLTGSRSSIQ